jgi:ZIP family zinc transporter
MGYAFMTALGMALIFVATSLGAALVFFVWGAIPEKTNAIFFGFASGIMLSACVWSLLLPAFEQIAPKWGEISFLPVGVSFLSGCAFLLILDALIAFIKGEKSKKANSSAAIQVKNRKIFLAVTLHNIPEGLAVGFAFGVARALATPAAYTSALMLSIGIAVQNFPEGAAVSIPLRREGYSRKKSFLFGQTSGMVEPVAGVMGALLVVYVEAILPYALSFAAGAMILVAVHELIPECQSNRTVQPYAATMGIVLGFATMMLLDVMLG